MPSSNNLNLHQQSDQDLIILYKRSRSLDVLGQLYHRYTHLVFGVCLKYLKNKEDSKDAVMQIFEKLISSLIKYEVQNFKSWLHVTSRNHCLIELRRRKSQKIHTNVDISIIESMESSIAVHHDDKDLLSEELNVMKKCMEKLKEEQKQCIQLFYIEEQSYKEVSLNSGYELKKVKSFIQNAKRNIKICIENYRE
jgi:RNA polymerase sigma-70 factor (ECF subfamily)